jgi:hypothetical protein
MFAKDEWMPHAPSFQTVRLAQGRHASAQQGVCTLELASMLAGERFSDQPRSACAAVAAFVRGYNDAIDDVRRQDLYAVAAQLVGSSGGEDITHERMWRLLGFARDLRPRRLGVLGPRLSYEDDLVKCESAGRHAAKVARRHPRVHADVLALIDELLAPARAPLPAPTVPAPPPAPAAPAAA